MHLRFRAPDVLLSWALSAVITPYECVVLDLGLGTESCGQPQSSGLREVPFECSCSSWEGAGSGVCDHRLEMGGPKAV